MRKRVTKNDELIFSRLDASLSSSFHSQINLKVPLSGQELADHLESKRLLAEKDLAQKTARVRTRKLLEADEVDSDDSDSDASDDGGMDGDVEGGAIGEDGEPISAPRRGGGGPGAGVDGGGWEEGGQKVSFDIYVKGQTTRATTFFKSATGQAPRFRMFPVGAEKRGRKVDVYGETIDVGVWLRKGKEIEEEGESEVVKAAKRRKIEEEKKAVSAGSSFVSTRQGWRGKERKRVQADGRRRERENSY